MNATQGFGQRWAAYRPTKGLLFWAAAAGAVATIVVGFAWGPQHYLKTKLGLETFDGLKQVMAKLLSKYGKNHKVTLISEGRSTLTRLDPGLKKEFNYPS